VERAESADREGSRPVARGTYERAIRMLTRDEGGFAPTIIRRIARSYIDDEMFDAALDCLAAAQHLSRARGDTSGVAHAMILMAIANLRRGDLDTAEMLYQKAHALAEASGDSRLEAMVTQDLGFIADMRGKSGAAKPIL
jgi:tetratricopeptide (TPR) repeat protein